MMFVYEKSCLLGIQFVSFKNQVCSR